MLNITAARAAYVEGRVAIESEDSTILLAACIGRLRATTFCKELYELPCSSCHAGNTRRWVGVEVPLVMVQS